MRSILGATTLAVLALSAVLIGTASAAKPPSGTANGCPNGGTYQVNPNVGAEASGTTTRIYTFSSWADQNPVNGVPGLVGYCVYANQAPTNVTATYTGWKASKAGQTFSFTRPNGEKTNIPLDGTTGVEVGRATFGSAMTGETILLHVSDAETCQDLYGGDVTTCFVLPGEEPGPVCDDGTGNTDAAYNAIPTDVEHCSPPSLGFEANQVAEFGDKVTLDTAGGTNLVSMTVDFQSYGCSVSGHWNTSDCVTTPGATFTVPGGITANVYNPTDLSTPIATSTISPSIPFRPSADPLCTGADAGKWFDPVSGACNFSLSVPLTFTFPAGTTFTSGQEVVWTVQFDTTHYGYSPIGEATTCFVSAPGCGYDSLNVGAKSYPGAPYAGTDVDADVAYLSTGGSLVADTGWAANRPLGQIVTG